MKKERPFDECKEPEPIEVETLTLCRDDFIDWVLKSTNEDSEFRVYNAKRYIHIGIDKKPFNG